MSNGYAALGKARRALGKRQRRTRMTQNIMGELLLLHLQEVKQRKLRLHGENMKKVIKLLEVQNLLKEKVVGLKELLESQQVR